MESTEDNQQKVITEQPKETMQMSLGNEGIDESIERKSSVTISETGSGYQADVNECNEFCIEFFSCFGLFETCCPANGEGCLTSTATFCGNILYSCLKC